MSADLNQSKEFINSACRFALLIDLDDAKAVLTEIERTETLLPLLDPTRWLQIRSTEPGHKTTVEAFVEFRTVLQGLMKSDGR